jgi:hypothetical protein
MKPPKAKCCAVEHCGRPVHAQGNCVTHYHRQYRLGTTHLPGHPGGRDLTAVDQALMHHRAQKAQAVRYGNEGAIAKADLALRAARIAKAIEREAAAGPPLPAELMAALYVSLRACTDAIEQATD